MPTMHTTYLGPTDKRGARIKVKSTLGLTASFPYDHGAHDAHHSAVLAFCKRFAVDLGWHTDMQLVRGESESGKGYTYLGINNVNLTIPKQVKLAIRIERDGVIVWRVRDHAHEPWREGSDRELAALRKSLGSAVPAVDFEMMFACA